MATVTIQKKLNKELELSIIRAAYQVLSDPDFRLELSNKAKERLRQASISKKKTVSFSEIKKNITNLWVAGLWDFNWRPRGIWQNLTVKSGGELLINLIGC